MYWFAGEMDEKDKVQGERVQSRIVRIHTAVYPCGQRERSSMGEARPLASAVASRNVKVGTRV